MKATKYIFTVKTETLSIDSVPALLLEAERSIFGESTSGHLVKDDGDTVEWNVKSQNVEF